MPVENVLAHILRHDSFVLVQSINVAVAQAGRDFETDVQELTEILVEAKTLGIVPERGREFLPRPLGNLRRQWQL